MDAKQILRTHPSLTTEQATKIAEHFDRYRAQVEYRVYESFKSNVKKEVFRKTHELENENSKLRAEHYVLSDTVRSLEKAGGAKKLIYMISVLDDFLTSKEVVENEKWLYEANCRDRSFNAGFINAINKIKKIMDGKEDKDPNLF